MSFTQTVDSILRLLKPIEEESSRDNATALIGDSDQAPTLAEEQRVHFLATLSRYELARVQAFMYYGRPGSEGGLAEMWLHHYGRLNDKLLVAGRTHEIGVRMALGSRAGGIIGMIVGQGLRIAVLGAVGGVLAAIATTHLLSRWLYEVSPIDLFTFATLSIVMIAVAVLACWIPARRAARVDPIASLRQE